MPLHRKLFKIFSMYVNSYTHTYTHLVEAFYTVGDIVYILSPTSLVTTANYKVLKL